MTFILFLQIWVFLGLSSYAACVLAAGLPEKQDRVIIMIFAAVMVIIIWPYIVLSRMTRSYVNECAAEYRKALYEE